MIVSTVHTNACKNKIKCTTIVSTVLRLYPLHTQMHATIKSRQGMNNKQKPIQSRLQSHYLTSSENIGDYLRATSKYHPSVDAL